MSRIGVIGLGRMGTALAKRLNAQGADVTTWTRSNRSLEGIGSAGELPALVAECDSLILSLLDDAAVAEVLDRLLNSDLDGRQIIETSTVIPNILQSRADAIAKAGGSCVDAPISGGPELVLSGSCGIFLGGSDEAAARAQSTLNNVTERQFHVGPLGAGLVMKAINNGMLQTYFAGLAEFLPMAREAGLPLEQTLQILSGGPAGLPMVKDRIPRITGADDSVGFALSAVQKDADVFARMLASFNLPTPLMTRFQEQLQEVAQAGAAEKDVAAFVTHAFEAREKG